MRKENKKMLAGVLSAVCVVSAFPFDHHVAAASTEARSLESIDKNKAAVMPLASALEGIPRAAAVAVTTQEWYQKAVSNVDGEIDVLGSGREGGRVIGKLYDNTIVTVEEKGDVWTKISADGVNGYVKNEMLAFGVDAVERAKEVCPPVAKPGKEGGSVTAARETKPAKTIEQIEEEKRAAEEAARRAAEEAERKAAEEAARKAAEEAAQKAAEEEAAQQAEQEAAISAGAYATGDEQALLAALIFCEAGGEPYEGQVAVGAVVLNRVGSGIFPNTIGEVIYQSGQFGPAITGKLDSVLADGRTTASCYQAAADALAGANPVGDALYFGNGDYGQLIGNHWFH